MRELTLVHSSAIGRRLFHREHRMRLRLRRLCCLLLRIPIVCQRLNREYGMVVEAYDTTRTIVYHI
jgi:hypothetical protein